jgi:hypothetical protein
MGDCNIKGQINEDINETINENLKERTSKPLPTGAGADFRRFALKRVRPMAFTEKDRVALYWPGRAIQKLRNDRQGNCSRSPKILPSAEIEILEGGCLLFRVFRAADAVEHHKYFLNRTTIFSLGEPGSAGGADPCQLGFQRISARTAESPIIIDQN